MSWIQIFGETILNSAFVYGPILGLLIAGAVTIGFAMKAKRVGRRSRPSCAKAASAKTFRPRFVSTDGFVRGRLVAYERRWGRNTKWGRAYFAGYRPDGRLLLSADPGLKGPRFSRTPARIARVTAAA